MFQPNVRSYTASIVHDIYKIAANSEETQRIQSIPHLPTSTQQSR